MLTVCCAVPEHSSGCCGRLVRSQVQACKDAFVTSKLSRHTAVLYCHCVVLSQECRGSRQACQGADHMAGTGWLLCQPLVRLELRSPPLVSALAGSTVSGTTASSCCKLGVLAHRLCSGCGGYLLSSACKRDWSWVHMWAYCTNRNSLSSE